MADFAYDARRAVRVGQGWMMLGGRRAFDIRQHVWLPRGNVPFVAAGGPRRLSRQAALRLQDCVLKKGPHSDAGREIEVRVETVSQLFDTLDPLPFRERDLDRHAEEYIVGWARELPKEARLKIIVHLPQSEIDTQAARELGDALNRYFSYRAEMIGLDLNELFRIGQRSLVIGLGVLAVCVLVSQAITSRFGPEHLGKFVNESLIILGWVANWRPIEIFLYDWWPLVRRRHLYRRLASATVAIRPHAPPGARQ